MAFTATITSKGQLTLPRAARAVLDVPTVDIEVVGGTVVLRPVRSVAGVLSAYAGPKETISRIRGKVWGEAGRARH